MPDQSLSGHLLGLLKEVEEFDRVHLGRLKLLAVSEGDKSPYDALKKSITEAPKDGLRVGVARELVSSLVKVRDERLVFSPPEPKQVPLLRRLCQMLLGNEDAAVTAADGPVKLVEMIRRLDETASVLLREDLAFRAARRLLVYRPVNDVNESLTLPLLAAALSLDRAPTGLEPLKALEDTDRLSMVRTVLLTGRDGGGLLRPRIDRVHLPALPGAYMGSMRGQQEPNGSTSVRRMQTEQVWGWLSTLFGGADRWEVRDAVLGLAARVSAADKEVELFPAQLTLKDGQPIDSETAGRVEVELVPSDSGKRGNGPLRVMADASGFALMPASTRRLSEGKRNKDESDDASKIRRERLSAALTALPLVSIRNNEWAAGSFRAYDARDGSLIQDHQEAAIWKRPDVGGPGFKAALFGLDTTGLKTDAFSASYHAARDALLAYKEKAPAPFTGLPSDDELPQGMDSATASLFRSLLIADVARPDMKAAPVRSQVLPHERSVGTPAFTFDDGLFALLAFATVGQEESSAGSFRRLAGAWGTGATSSEVPLAALYALAELGDQEATALSPKREVSTSPPRLPIRGIYLQTITSALASTPLINADGGAAIATVTAWASDERKRVLKPVVEDMLKRRTLQTLGSVIYALGGDSLGGMPEVLRRFGRAWRNLEGFDQESQAASRPLEHAGGAKGLQRVGFASPTTTDLVQTLKAVGYTTVRHLAMSSPPELAQLYRNCMPDVDHLATAELAATVCSQARKIADTRQPTASTRRALNTTVWQGNQPAIEARAEDRSESPSTPQSPDLQKLFGSLDVCECDEDASVYGAPAYLVDVFEFLRFRTLFGASAASIDFLSADARKKCCGAPEPQNALEVLLQRRPDLEHLDLSSENNQRRLPYIDLVNEVLEAAIAGDRCTLADLVPVLFNEVLTDGQSISPSLCKNLRKQNIDVSPAARFSLVQLPTSEGPCREVFFLRDRTATLRFQRDATCNPWNITRLKNSTRSEEALAAEPEYTNFEAYKTLSSESSGYALPFSLAALQIKSYLSMAEVRLSEVDLPWYETPESNASLTQPRADKGLPAVARSGEDDRLRRAGLALEMSWPMLQLVCGKQSGHDFWFWAKGRVSGDLTAREFLRGIRRTGERPQFSPLSALCRTAFLGTDSAEVGLQVVSVAEGKDCSSDKLLVHWLGGKPAELSLQPVSRFLRLFHALSSNGEDVGAKPSWSIQEIDQAIMSPGIGNGKLNVDVLEGIRDINALSRRFPKVLRAEWLSMFGVVHYKGFRDPKDSLYWHLFLNPVRTQQNELSPAYTFFQPADVEDVGDKVVTWTSDLAMRLGIAVKDLELLVKQLVPEQDTQALITHVLISRLFAHCRMRQMLSLDWVDWLAWRRLYLQASGETDVFDRPAALIKFLSFYDQHLTSCTLRPIQLERALTGFGAAEEPSDPLSILPKDRDVFAALKAIATECAGQSVQAVDVWAGRAHPIEESQLALDSWWGAWLQANPPAPSGEVTLARSIWAEMSSLADAMAAARAAALQAPNDNADGLRHLPQPDELQLQGQYFAAFERSLGEQIPATGEGRHPSAVEAWGVVEPLWKRVLLWAGFGGSAEQRAALVHQAVADLAAAREVLRSTSTESRRDAKAIEKAETGLRRAQQSILFQLHAPIVAMKVASERTDSVIRVLAPLTAISPALLSSVLSNMATDNGSVLDLLITKTNWPQIHKQINAPDGGKEINASGVFVPPAAEFGKVWVAVLRLVRAGRLIRSVKLDDETWAWVLGQDGRTLRLLDPLQLPSWEWKHKKDSDGRVVSVETVPVLPVQTSSSADWERLLCLVRLETEFPGVEPAPSSGKTITAWKVVRAALILRQEIRSEVPPTGEQLDRAARVLCAGIDMLLSAPVDTAWNTLRIDWDDTKASSNSATPSISSEQLVEKLLHWGTFEKLRTVFDWQQRSGLPMTLIHALCRTPADEEVALGHAVQVRDALKSRFAEADWFSNLKASMNRVREAKRDALVAFLVSRPPKPGRSELDSAKRLYQHYLLDVAKSSRELTSRIAQAHDVVQLFVSRSFMGQEPQVQITAANLPSWQPWDWMSSYRVWQAARKVFLYPENWLYPELRDDRSVFFREFQSELSQSKLDKRTEQNAVVTYVRKLNDVARLEIVSSFNEVVGSSLIVHVVGRTRTEPRAYFYRQWVDQLEWTPWERIEVEINGDHLLVFARNGRVHLAWLVSERKPRKANFTLPENGGAEVKAAAQESAAVWSLKLALSEYASGAWLPKRVSPSALTLESDVKSDESSFEELKQLQLVYEGKPNAEISLLQETVKGEGKRVWTVTGSYALSSCSGHVEAHAYKGDEVYLIYPSAQGAVVEAGRFIEAAGRGGRDDSLVLVEGPNTAAAVDQLMVTPGRFSLTVPRQASVLDFTAGVIGVAAAGGAGPGDMRTVGAWMPAFYHDDVCTDVLVDRPEVKSLQLLLGRLGEWSLEAETSAKLKSAFRELSDRIDNGVFNDEDVAIRLAAIAGTSAGTDWIDKLYERIPEALGDDQSKVALYSGRLLHPEACTLVRLASGHLDRWWMDLYTRSVQATPFSVRGRNDEKAVAFNLDDGFAGYNWELFVHIPLLLAQRHADAGNFEDALRCFKMIFNPLAASQRAESSQKVTNLRDYWITRPFHEHTDDDYEAQRIDLLLDPEQWKKHRGMTGDGASAWNTALRGLYLSVKAWRADPANPYQVARHRWVAMQKAVVYRLISMLVDWGDSKFRLFEREALTKATQIYEMASDLLGERPMTDVPAGLRPKFSYEEIRVDLDADNEDLLTAIASARSEPQKSKKEWEEQNAFFTIYNDHFCIPQNDELSRLWDRVEDRLYKIRNSQDIDGVERALALFSPPIDPGALVRARGSGQSLGQVLAGLSQPLPHHRFETTWNMAMEFARELRTLGGQLQSALERMDGEALSLLRTQQERELNEMVRTVRQLQIKEAGSQAMGLEAMRSTVRDRQREYEGREETSPMEEQSFNLTQQGKNLRLASQVANMLGSFIGAAPDAAGGFAAIGPLIYVVYGGSTGNRVAKGFADALAALADISNTEAGVTATRASYRRRKEDWTFQAKQAESELKQITHQIKAAELRTAIAAADLSSLERQIEHRAQEVEYLRSKFTNTELYEWQARQTASLYYRAYQLALEFARKAERCLNFELPPAQDGSPMIVGSGHWDSAHRGLGAADALMSDLTRLSEARAKRDLPGPEPFEVSYSLRDNDPAALLRLRTEGRCGFSLTRDFFDGLFPGHVLRRIVGHAFRIDCVAGPNTPVSVSLTLKSSQIHLDDNPDGRSIINPTPSRSDYTCTGLRHPDHTRYSSESGKYRLFEGAGAISDWEVQIPGDRVFDWSTISDFRLTIWIKHVVRNMRAAPSRRRTPKMVSLRDNLPAEFMRMIDGDFAPVGIGALLQDSDGEYVPADDEGIAQVCVLMRPTSPSASAPKVEIRASKSDSQPINSNTSAPYASTEKGRQQVRLSKRTLSRDEVKALTGGGAFVSLREKQGEVLDVVVLMPPRI